MITSGLHNPNFSLFKFKERMKPLGYYTNYTPNQAGVLHDFEEAYGSQLEHLNKTEKLALIGIIAYDLCFLGSITLPYRAEIYNWMPAIKELPIEDQEGLLEALINSVRYQQP